MSDQPTTKLGSPTPSYTAPAPDPSSATELETLSHLRHALRTPLNQIIGYSEILIESAHEKNTTGLLLDLKKIHSAGGQLLAVLNDTLALWKIECGKFDLRRMRHEMIPPLNAVLGFSTLSFADPAIARIPGLSDDLAKIREAARNLYNLIEGANVLQNLSRHNLRHFPPLPWNSSPWTSPSQPRNPEIPTPESSSSTTTPSTVNYSPGGSKKWATKPAKPRPATKPSTNSNSAPSTSSYSIS